MKNIFTGMLLVFLDFNLTLDNSIIGLIPDFVGYVIMVGGLNELSGKSDRFEKAKSFASIMVVYSGVVYVMDVFGFSTTMDNVIVFVLGFLSTIASVYISYNIVMGVKDIETSEARNLNADALYSTWNIFAIFSIAMCALIFIQVLAIFSLIGSFVFAIAFLIKFNRTKDLYYETEITTH